MIYTTFLLPNRSSSDVRTAMLSACSYWRCRAVHRWRRPGSPVGAPICLSGPGTSTRPLTIFWRSRLDRHSAAYGQVVRTLPAPGGRGAHHVEYEMSTSQLFANSFDTGHTFVFDLSDAMHPRLFSDFGDAGLYSHPHSFARTPTGTDRSPPIKVSPPITTQPAGWLNWTSVDECSEPRAQPNPRRSGSAPIQPALQYPNSTGSSQRRPTCTE